MRRGRPPAASARAIPARGALAIALALVPALGGCPASPPGGPPAGPPGAPAAEGEAPGAADPGKGAGPGASGSQAPGGAEAGATGPTPGGGAGQPGAERPATLATGEVLRPAAEVALGLVGFAERAGRPTARLAVGFGHLSYQVECAAGEAFVAGPRTFEVTRVDPGADVVALAVAGGGRLEGSIPDEVDLVVPAPAGARLELDAMGLHRLPDGVVLAVGNVVEREGGPTVWLAAYPAGYAQDPMRDYDLWPAARPGAALAGKVASLTVESATPPGAAGERGRLLVQRAP